MVRTSTLHGHTLSQTVHKPTMNGCGLMALGTTLMVMTWQQMVGIMLHGMANIENITLMSMVIAYN